MRRWTIGVARARAQRAARRILDERRVHQRRELGRAAGNRRRLLIEDLEGERRKVLGFEWVLQCRHLVEDAAERPHVRSHAVRRVVEQLGAQIVRRAAHCPRERARGVEHLGDAKVAELDDAAPRQEDVGRLEVAVQDAPRVQVLERQRHLDEPVQQLRLAQRAGRLPEGLYSVLEVAALAVLHEEVELRARAQRVDVLHDVRVVELREQLRLLVRRVPLLVVQRAQLDPLHHAVLGRRLLDAEVDGAEGARAYFFHHFVVVHPNRLAAAPDRGVASPLSACRARRAAAAPLRLKASSAEALPGLRSKRSVAIVFSAACLGGSQSPP